MSINLSLLPKEEKNKIEIDKQAAYLIWQVKQAKAGVKEITAQKDKLKNDDEKLWFEESLEKYKKVMGLT